VANKTIQFTVTNNQLTGTIPTDYFQWEHLKVFAISGNCLSGSLPVELCNAQFLQSLVLDGLSSAKSCQKQIFPRSSQFNSFRLKKVLQGSIPSCIFEMPRLKDLFLSGNELTGSIPRNITLNPGLMNLRLSYNRLTGTIPDVIQNRSWVTLDLSYNKLRGHLTSQLDDYPVTLTTELVISGMITNQTQSLHVDVNRLSGMIPASLRYIQDISILNGNIFYCSIDRHQIPEHDPKASSYICASDSVYQVLFGYALLAFILLMTTIYWKWTSKNIMKRVMFPILKHIRRWNLAFGVDEIQFQYSENRLSSLNVTTSQFNELLGVMRDLRNSCLWFACGSVFMLMPIYKVINLFVSMFENKYMWEFSSIYMTGYAARATLMVIFGSVVAVVYYVFIKRIRNKFVQPATKYNLERYGLIQFI
jgi:hypothetical protein